MFKRMLSAFGIGGPSVDTVLDSPHAVPGQAITGQVRVQGGSSDTEVGQVVLSLVVRAEDENDQDLLRLVVQQGVRVSAGRLVSIPFQLTLPHETPITAVGGTALPGIGVGVRTELVISGAPDKGDLDTVLVGPLPSQDGVLDAFGQLGFSFCGTEIEAGRLPGVPHELGFHQELEFFPPAQYASRVHRVRLTFVAKPDRLHVVLRPGAHAAPGTSGHLQLSHEEAQGTDWAAAISGWLTQVAGQGSANLAFAAQPGQLQGHHEQQRGLGMSGMGMGGSGMGGMGTGGAGMGGPGMGGPGMGGVLAAGAAGAVGGMVLGEVADEFFGDDE
ncbi:sporulation protein [Lentzea sp. NPDC005914]|uniref:sporulation protein n=1 Tax=Lentzea sp. NPDC005914 TaxID=3154572 RepID=UPI0033D14ADC